jgi:hypothetical protein
MKEAPYFSVNIMLRDSDDLKRQIGLGRLGKSL